MSKYQSASVPETADILIVGGGAAGCVLASRLSEQPSRRVVLIEAGPDVGVATPPDIRDIFPRAYANPKYFWPHMMARMVPRAAARPFTQARLLGGGSSVMGMWALRGLADDFDGWGLQGWSFPDVLPYFRKLERDLDIADSKHGNDGPIPIHRIDPGLWSPFTRALVEAGLSAGYHRGSDMNGSDADGIYALPLSADRDGRASSLRYLDETVRRRDNLSIGANCTVEGLQFEGTRATGVRCRSSEGAEIRIAARQTILACGAIHSPALLLRSGVGPSAALKALGIDVIADNPAVGRNLQNHVFLHLGCFIRPAARQATTLPNYITTCLRLSSGEHGARSADLMLGFIARPGAHRLGNRMGMVGVHLYAPASRGQVTLRRDISGLKPDIDFCLLQDDSDRRRLTKATLIARDLLSDPRVADLSSDVFMLPARAPIRLLNAPGPWSVAANWGLAAVATLPAPARRAAIRAALGHDALLSSDDDSLSDRVLASAAPMFHVAGSCAMGAALNADLTVRGIQNLYVADASAMPTVPRANTNIPTIMLAERAADMIRTHQVQ
ncbi:5-(hydroxymethyl)furfural/furfural oxidase [Nitrobacteraceae bacterium AZCC 2161]